MRRQNNQMRIITKNQITVATWRMIEIINNNQITITKWEENNQEQNRKSSNGKA